MSLYINHNLMAANAARNLSNVYGDLATSVQRLSSGLRINSAADDAAGLAIREMMRADIAALNQGVRNASDAISMIQTAEGAMSVIDEKLIRMKELAEQAATGTYTTAQRLIMDSEYQAMAAEIDRIASATDFNGIKLLDGSLLTQHDGSGLKVHFGTGNESAEDYYYVSIADMKATSITGLQVGGGASGAEASVFRTNSLDMASTSDTLDHYGAFGIQLSNDGADWGRYGYVNYGPGDTLDDIVNNINRGNAGGNSVDFSTCTTTELDGESIFVSGFEYRFNNSTLPGLTAISLTTLSIGTQGASLASVAQWFQCAVNYNASASPGSSKLVAVYYSAEPQSVILSATSFGLDAMAITSSYSTLVFMSPTFTGGGQHNAVSAEAVQDSDGSGWELQITATNGQYMRLTMPDGHAFELNASSEGGDPSGDSVDPTVALRMDLSGTYVYADSRMDQTNEWFSQGAGVSWDGANILTQSAAQAALGQIDEAINRKDTARAALGATQNRLENTITNLQIQAENLQAAESRISDVDVALEMTEFTRNNILTQAAVSMLAQANSLPNLALSLLGG